MSAVLIVDDDATLRDALSREVRTWGFDVFTESSAESALELLRQRSIDVLLTDLRMGGLDGIDLIRAARSASPRTQTLLMSAFATARDHQLATEHGTIRVLCKPFTPLQLRRSLREALDSREGFRGMVHGLSLLDMLQLFHLSRRSVSLTLGGNPPGRVHFEGGELIHASLGKLSGYDALLHLLQNDSGTVSSSSLEANVPRTISAAFDGLLMRLISEIDEARRSERYGSGVRSGGAEVEEPSAPHLEEAVPSAHVSESGLEESAAESAVGSLEEEERTGCVGGSPRDMLATVSDTASEVRPAAVANAAAESPAPGATAVDVQHVYDTAEQPAERHMTEIDEACQRVVQETDGGIACGVVDLDTGMLLGVFNNAGYSQSLNEIVAAACVDMFRGSNVNRVNQAVRAHRGVPENGEHYFEEILVTSKRNTHFMKTIRSGKAVIVLVTRKSASVGMGWAMLKSLVPSIEPLVP